MVVTKLNIVSHESVASLVEFWYDVNHLANQEGDNISINYHIPPLHIFARIRNME